MVSNNACLARVRQFIEKSNYDLLNDFRNKRVSKKKRLIDYESSDGPIESPDFFNIMIDSIVSNMDSRILFLKEHFQNVGFLYDLKI